MLWNSLDGCRTIPFVKDQQPPASTLHCTSPNSSSYSFVLVFTHHGQRNVCLTTTFRNFRVSSSFQQILRPLGGSTKCLRCRSQESLSKEVSLVSLFTLFRPLISLLRALRLHPDKGGDPELFKEVTHASVFPFYASLSTVLNNHVQIRSLVRQGQT